MMLPMPFAMPFASPLVTLLSIPSPSEGVWHLGPVPIRAYALCIIAGIVAAIWIGERRWVSRGGEPGEVSDLAIWAVPFGLVGGRLYHVITDWHLYFGEDRNPVTALYVWRGGLGIWGEAGYRDVLSHDGDPVGVGIAGNTAQMLELEVSDPDGGQALLGAGLSTRWGIAEIGVGYRGRMGEAYNVHQALVEVSIAF